MRVHFTAGKKVASHIAVVIGLEGKLGFIGTVRILCGEHHLILIILSHALVLRIASGFNIFFNRLTQLLNNVKIIIGNRALREHGAASVAGGCDSCSIEDFICFFIKAAVQIVTDTDYFYSPGRIRTFGADAEHG